MRKTGIAMTVIGAAAFAALLVWGLTLGSSAVRADATATPTATPTATGTAAATGTATPTGTATATPAPETCAPVIPTTFNGAVTLNGAPVPDGTVIKAVGSDGVTWGTSKATSAGKYVVDVPDHLPAAPPCFPGGKITFSADSATCTPQGDPTTGLKDLPLTCGGAATATATATATTTATATKTATATVTATATATATPKGPPATGMGSPSEGGGFLWWPLALAAAALTCVAGLYTARTARR